MDSRRVSLGAYRVFAWVTGVGLVLLCAAMVNRLFTGDQKPVAIIGMLHGFLYMGYVVCALVLAERCRWRPVRALLVALAGTVPFVSFVAERKVTRLVRRESLAAPARTTDQQADLST